MTLVIKTEMQKHCFYGNKLGHVDTECVCSAQLRGEQPSYLKGDNFFKFICTDCSEDGKESFERMRLTWQQVNTTTHTLTHQGQQINVTQQKRTGSLD